MLTPMQAESEVIRPYRVKSRTRHGIGRYAYREYIVVRIGGAVTYGPFLSKSEAKKQASYLNEAADEVRKADHTDPVVKRYLAEKDNPVCECGGFESEHDERGCRHCACPSFVAAEPFEDRESERC